MAIPVHKAADGEVEACVARYDDLVSVDGGLPDMEVEGYHRTFRNVVGFQQPEGSETYSPVGDLAKPAIGHLEAGFGLGYVSARPGQGVMMHTHDTNETFVIMEGRWKMRWEAEDGDREIELSEKDVISFPPGLQRQFICAEARPGEAKGILLGVIGGDTPGAEMSPEATAILREKGLMPAAAE
jgi:quercetin dioxygenase-like cupin family protein